MLIFQSHPLGIQRRCSTLTIVTSSPQVKPNLKLGILAITRVYHRSSLYRGNPFLDYKTIMYYVMLSQLSTEALLKAS